MKRVVLAALIVVTQIGMSGAEQPSLLRCTALDAAGLTDDGKLDAHEAEAERILWKSFIVDIITGVIRPSDLTSSVRWSVVEKGGGGNDTVLMPTHWPSDEIVAPDDFLRVRQWNDGPNPIFIAYGLSSVVTGKCEPVH